MTSTIRLVLAAGLLALLGAACGGEDAGDPTPSDSTTTTTTPMTTVEDEADLPVSGACLVEAEDCADNPGGPSPEPPILSGEDEGEPPPDDPADPVELPTSEDLSLADTLAAFAQDPSPATWAAIEFAPEVALGLADEVQVTVTSNDLLDPATWILEKEPFRGRTGPYSALDLLASAGPVVVTVGPHDHCASPPVPAPAELADLRRVAVQPIEATSCLEWFTVDVFVDGDGTVHGVTLDLYEP